MHFSVKGLRRGTLVYKQQYDQNDDDYEEYNFVPFESVIADFSSSSYKRDF